MIIPFFSLYYFSLNTIDFGCGRISRKKNMIIKIVRTAIIADDQLHQNVQNQHEKKTHIIKSNKTCRF